MVEKISRDKRTSSKRRLWSLAQALRQEGRQGMIKGNLEIMLQGTLKGSQPWGLSKE